MEFCVLFRKIGKNLSNKYIQKALDTAKKSKTDAIEIVSKKKKKFKKLPNQLMIYSCIKLLIKLQALKKNILKII